jgi:hypothetical protein
MEFANDDCGSQAVRATPNDQSKVVFLVEFATGRQVETGDLWVFPGEFATGCQG